MKSTPSFRSSLPAYAIAVAGSLLIVYLLVRTMQQHTRPQPVDQARVEERAKALAELRAADSNAVYQLGWVNQAKGIVRLPVARAVELTVKEYQANPVAARSNLLVLSEKASAPAPKPEPPPNPFE